MLHRAKDSSREWRRLVAFEWILNTMITSLSAKTFYINHLQTSSVKYYVDELFTTDGTDYRLIFLYVFT